jgi:cytochrome c oxidase assembly protein subunit 11
MNRSQRTALTLMGVVILMIGLSFAAVPFYRWFCQTTGFGGTTATAATAPDQVLERVITIRFNGSTGQNMPWKFRPLQRRMDLHIGETGLAFFEAYNPTGRSIAGTASFNVTPDAAGGYFTKIECFCFTEQILGPGERVEMPVSFFIDPDIVKDAEPGAVEKNSTTSGALPRDN